MSLHGFQDIEIFFFFFFFFFFLFFFFFFFFICYVVILGENSREQHERICMENKIIVKLYNG